MLVGEVLQLAKGGVGEEVAGGDGAVVDRCYVDEVEYCPLSVSLVYIEEVKGELTGVAVLEVGGAGGECAVDDGQ